jgi:hypothetical protein
MRDFRWEKMKLRGRLRQLRGLMRGMRARLKQETGGCGSCKGSALKAATMQYRNLQKEYLKIVGDETEAIKSASHGHNASDRFAYPPGK